MSGAVQTPHQLRLKECSATPASTCLGSLSPLVLPHHQERSVRVLGRNLEGEALYHGLLNVAHIGQRLALLDGHCLLVLGLHQRLELIQSYLQLFDVVKANILLGITRPDISSQG